MEQMKLIYTPPQKVLGQLCLSRLRLLLQFFFNWALLVSPQVLNRKISHILKNIAPVEKSDNWQHVWKYWIIRTSSFKGLIDLQYYIENIHGC